MRPAILCLLLVAACSAPKQDPDAVITAYTARLATNPNDADAYYRRGLAYSQRNGVHDMDSAVADFTASIEHNPSLAEAYYHRADVSGPPWADRAKARADYDAAIRLRPSFAEAYLGRAHTRSWGPNGEVDSLLTDLSTAIRLKPDLAEAYQLRGLVYEALKRLPDSALADYTRAIELDPSDAESYIGRGVTYINRLHDPERALRDFDQAVRLHPDSAGGYRLRARALAALARQASDSLSRRALGELNRAIALDSSDGWWQRAEVYAAMGEADSAIAAYTEALTRGWDFERPALHFERALMYLRQGERTRAIVDLRASLAASADTLRRRRAQELLRRLGTP